MKDIQAELKAPKGQYNKFGTYYYRSCEDIVEAAKPVLLKHDCYLNISDEIVQAGDRIYVKATASVFKGSEMLATSTAFAREPESQKGMSESQITGTASSYARKYALNGLLAIDDTKDADTDEYRKAINSAATIEELNALYKSMSTENKEDYIDDFKAAKEKLK
jgi:hypothetical protein